MVVSFPITDFFNERDQMLEFILHVLVSIICSDGKNK